MIRKGHLPLSFVVGALALLFAGACAAGRNTAPGPRALSGEVTTAAAAELLFTEDTPGLLAAAARLCTPITARDARAAGLRGAQRALENLAGAPADRRSRAALALSRCAALCAELEPDADRLLAVTQVGIAAAGVAGAGSDPRAAYYLAVNLGLQIRLLGLEAIGRLGEMQNALAVAAADPAEDQGGALRVLAMLYLRAPAWPVGPGDPEAALPLLKDAVAGFPSHPQNRLFYAMALAESGEPEKARGELAVAAALARPSLWGASAAGWLAEIRTLQEHLAQ